MAKILDGNDHDSGDDDDDDDYIECWVVMRRSEDGGWR